MTKKSAKNLKIFFLFFVFKIRNQAHTASVNVLVFALQSKRIASKSLKSNFYFNDLGGITLTKKK